MESNISDNINQIISQFNIEGDFSEYNPFGFGHINDTYLIVTKEADQALHQYILQRINHNVFKSPEKVMKNIEAITQYLQEKVIQAGGNPDREAMTLIKTKSGENYYKSPIGNYWRVSLFIDGTISYQKVKNSTDFYETGKIFGRFHYLLADFPVDSLEETIIDFHNTPKRLENLRNSIKLNKVNRVKDVQDEIDFCLHRASTTQFLIDLIKQNELPLRVTHNDTKLNNVLLDEKTGEGVCIIDMDTVMPGSVLYDFGDAIRSGANPAKEDEQDLSKVRVDLILFECFTKGFLESARELLNTFEIEYLAFSAILMTFECGVRFLTDYLQGDTYFKTQRKEQNLDRARVQFQLVKDMEENYESMKKIVYKYL